MLVYGHRSFALDLRSFLRTFTGRLARVSDRPAHDDVVDLLIDFAEAESGHADALCPESDDQLPALGPWRHTLDTLTGAFHASLCGDDRLLAGAFERLRSQVAALESTLAVDIVQAKAAEGFSCYALYPEQYVDAARQLTADPDQPVVCIGLRSIGAVLGSLVASTLRAAGRHVESRTVRPRGHPFDRRLRLGPVLTRFLAEQRASRFVIVDEGPGLSGSSFASVVDALGAMGISRAQMVLVPSWRPAPDVLRSDRARDVFATVKVVVGTSPVERLAVAACGVAAASDVSAGRWRSIVFGDHQAQWPAVHPQHERVKYVDAPDAPTRVSRFAGLGRHGRAKHTRAAALHDTGFGPAPLGIDDGMLTLEWLPGTPRPIGVSPTREEIDRVADYLACVANRLPAGREDSGNDLLEMVRVNTVEALGSHAKADIDRLLAVWQRTERGALVAVDGRMLPHDWIRNGKSLSKVDALDHHFDDFLPGCRDIAWDIAGTCVEWQLQPVAQDALVTSYVTRTRDAQIVERMPFFTAAYLAYRVGYTSLAAESLAGTADGDRFRGLLERYRRSLAAHVAHPRRVAAR